MNPPYITQSGTENLAARVMLWDRRFGGIELKTPQVQSCSQIHSSLWGIPVEVYYGIGFS
jgi:hypothetical protein